MKVLFVNGSSHVQGTTMAAITEMVHIFEKEGIETEVIWQTACNAMFVKRPASVYLQTMG